MTNTPPAIGDPTGPNFKIMRAAWEHATEAERDAFTLWLVTEGNEEPAPALSDANSSPSPATLKAFDALMACD